jgi:hypothetical protein
VIKGIRLKKHPDCSLKINQAILKIISQEFSPSDRQYSLTKIENSKMCVEVGLDAGITCS